MTAPPPAGGDSQTDRYFLSYSGAKLPLNLVTPLAVEALSNRNTYIRARYNEAGRLTEIDKLVYGEVELMHRYSYHPNGALHRADIAMPEEETVTLYFDETGAPAQADRQ